MATRQFLVRQSAVDGTGFDRDIGPGLFGVVGANAADPFTYQSSVDMSTATTSAQFRSGTFDFDLAGGISQSVTITPLITSDLSIYDPVGWTCKAGGAAYPFTTAPVAGHAPWTSITLTVLANKAVSCTQQVTFL